MHELLYEIPGCEFESSCSHLHFRFHACFEQGVPWHSGNHKVWIHSAYAYVIQTRTWHDKNIHTEINIITFGKSENLGKKILICKKLAEILLFFYKKVLSWFFLNCPGGNSIWEKLKQIALPNLDYIGVIQ